MTTPADTRISDELLPCPFCGWEAEVVSGGPGNHFVQCKGCRATSDDRHIDSAVAAWNRRALITELRDRRAQAVTVTDEMVERAANGFVGSLDIEEIYLGDDSDLTSVAIDGVVNFSVALREALEAALASPPPAQSADAAKEAQSSVDHWQQLGHGPTPNERIAMLAKEAVMACRGEPEAADLRSVAGFVYDRVLIGLSSPPAPASGGVPGDVTIDDIAEVLFRQRQTRHSWEEAIADETDPESDGATLASICRDDAKAVLSLIAALTQPAGKE